MKVNKPRRAVLVTISVVGESLTLSLDDAAQSATSHDTWSQKDHVTHKEFRLKEFTDMKFDEAELADLAGYIVARLNAYIELGESS
jgi:hypothetical protein